MDGKGSDLKSERRSDLEESILIKTGNDLQITREVLPDFILVLLNFRIQ